MLLQGRKPQQELAKLVVENLLASAAIATPHVCYPRCPLRAQSVWSLQGAKSQQELAKLVAENLLAAKTLIPKTLKPAVPKLPSHSPFVVNT